MKRIAVLTLIALLLSVFISCAPQAPDYTGTWMSFMAEQNGKQYKMSDYFSMFEGDYTVVLNIRDDGTYTCISYLNDQQLDAERGTYTKNGRKIDFNEANTYNGEMVNGYLAIKYDSVTIYFGKISG